MLTESAATGGTRAHRATRLAAYTDDTQPTTGNVRTAD
jgi:hypothetical protein